MAADRVPVAPAVQQRFYELTGNMPPRRSTWQSPALAASPYAKAFRDAAGSGALAAEGAGVGAHRQEMRLAAERVVQGVASVDQACVALDRKTDEILEKRRWMLDQGSRRHESAARRLVVRRAGADRARRVLLPAGARGARDEPDRFRSVRAQRFRQPALHRLRQLRASCCASRCSGRRSATPSTSWCSACRCRSACRSAPRCW